MLVLLGVYLMAQSIARTNISMCQAANICASQPTYYHAARNGKSRGKPGRRSADHPATLWLSQTAELPGRRTSRPEGRRSLRRHLAAGVEGALGVLHRGGLAARQAVLHRLLRSGEAVEKQGQGRAHGDLRRRRAQHQGDAARAARPQLLSGRADAELHELAGV